MNDKTKFISVDSDNTHTVYTGQGAMVSGPRLNSENAVKDIPMLGLERGIELGEVTMMESSANGTAFFHLCIDGIPHMRFKHKSDMEVISKAFKAGLISLVHRRFLGGLGDLIMLSGAAVFLSMIHDKISLTCSEIYQQEFKRIFVHYPNIEIGSVIKDDRHYLDSGIPDNLCLHNQRTSLADTHLDQFERTYRNFGIPYRYRWDLCPVAKACEGVEQLDVPKEPYIFIHNDPARGFVIDRNRLPAMPIYSSDAARSESVLSFKNVIENAAEVHLWDSSFFHLTESLEPRGVLYYHRYVSAYHKRYSDYKTRRKWSILT